MIELRYADKFDMTYAIVVNKETNPGTGGGTGGGGGGGGDSDSDSKFELPSTLLDNNMKGTIKREPFIGLRKNENLKNMNVIKNYDIVKSENGSIKFKYGSQVGQQTKSEYMMGFNKIINPITGKETINFFDENQNLYMGFVIDQKGDFYYCAPEEAGASKVGTVNKNGYEFRFKHLAIYYIKLQ